MNLIFSKYSVFFIFFAFFAFPLSGQANDSVVVTFTGILLAKSCDITTGSKDQSVKMGTYDANEFLNVGDVSSSGVSANVRFTGDADAINSALLRLSAGADSATGLGIEILDNNDVAIAINGESGFRDLVLNENGDANLTFKLRYKSTQENVHAGQANALLYFDIDYQ